MARPFDFPEEAVRALRDCEDRMSLVQILLLVLWLIALAIRRVCGNVQEVCVHLWYLVQGREETMRYGAGAMQPAGFIGEGARVSKIGAALGTGIDLYWKHLVDHPEEWWDNRVTRRNPRAPDFKHRVSRQALWIDNPQTPDWVRLRFPK
jgi:hypothetical protein